MPAALFVFCLSHFQKNTTYTQVPQYLTVLGVSDGWVTLEWSMIEDVKKCEHDEKVSDDAGVREPAVSLSPQWNMSFLTDLSQCQTPTQNQSHDTPQTDTANRREDNKDNISSSASRSQSLVRGVSKTWSVVSKTSTRNADVSLHGVKQKPRYTHAQVQIDGRDRMNRHNIIWDKKTSTHLYRISVEVGKGLHTIAIRVHDSWKTSNTNTNSHIRHPHSNDNTWSAWSESLQIDAVSRVKSSKVRNIPSAHKIHPHLPPDFYRQKLKVRVATRVRS